ARGDRRRDARARDRAPPRGGARGRAGDVAARRLRGAERPRDREPARGDGDRGLARRRRSFSGPAGRPPVRSALNSPDLWMVLAGVAAALALGAIVERQARKRQSKLAAALARHVSRPLLLLLPVAFGRFVQPLLAIEPTAGPIVYHATTLVLIFAFGWVFVSL